MTPMAEATNPGDVETLGLIERAVQGDQTAWGELLARIETGCAGWLRSAWTGACRDVSTHRM